ncbi:MAG: glycosyltransferase family 4 protein [Bacteroidetes bacterium]|nr:glycosyltransferase family 4 protein [Bacteroidota bacterium]
MNLLFLSQYYPPETGAGATRAETIRRYLGSNGWNVDLVCEFPNYPSGIIPPEYKGLSHHVTKDAYGSIIRTWVIPTRRENFFQQMVMFTSFMFSSLRYCLLNPKNYDAIYVTSPPIFGAVTGFLLSKLYGIPYFFEVRDIWPAAAIETGHINSNNVLYKFSKFVEKKLYKHARIVIPVTRRSETLIKDACPDIETKVIYNGVDLRRFKVYEQKEAGVQPIKNKNTFTVGYVGTIGVIHDLKTVIKAAKLLEDHTDIEFLIIGDGSQSVQLRQVIDEIQPKNLEWVGLMHHNEIPKVMAKLDLGLNPVYDTKVFESIITVKFFEYLACNVPVINMASGLLRDVGDASNAAVTIQPENAELLADTILELKANPALRSQMSQNGRPFIKRYFDREKWVGELGRLLERSILEANSSHIPVGKTHSDRTRHDQSINLPDLPW